MEEIGFDFFAVLHADGFQRAGSVGDLEEGVEFLVLGGGFFADQGVVEVEADGVVAGVDLDFEGFVFVAGPGPACAALDDAPGTDARFFSRRVWVR